MFELFSSTMFTVLGAFTINARVFVLLSSPRNSERDAFAWFSSERKRARKCETRFMVWRRPTVSPCCEPAGDRWTDGKSTI